MEVVMSVGIGLLSAASSLLILSGDGELRSDWDELGRTRDRTVTWARGMRASIVRRAEERGLALPGSRKKRERLEGAMVEAFGALAASMASGLSLAQAMRYVGSHAQEPVRTEFLRAEAQVACGVGMTEALDELVERLHAPGLDFVTLALKVSRRTGAPLSDVLGGGGAFGEGACGAASKAGCEDGPGAHVGAIGGGDARCHGRVPRGGLIRFQGGDCDGSRCGLDSGRPSFGWNCLVDHQGGHEVYLLRGGCKGSVLMEFAELVEIWVADTPDAVIAVIGPGVLCGLAAWLGSEDGALEMARACCAHVRVVGGLAFRKMRALALEMLCSRSRGIGMGEVAEMTDIVRLGLSAGLSFDASLSLYCEGRSGELAQLMEKALFCWQVGVTSRDEALDRVAQDAGVRALGSFAAAVSQALELGAPLAETLEGQGREMRAAHRAYVEREIERAPVKLLIPTGTLILPALLLSIVGPLLAAADMV